MLRDEFIRTASRMGYCSKKQAEKYAQHRDEFSEADFIEVFEMVQEEERLKTRHGRQLPFGGRTTKHYFGDSCNIHHERR